MTKVQQFNSRINSLDTPKLKELVSLAFASNEDGADLILSAGLRALEGRLSETDFLSFCETIN